MKCFVGKDIDGIEIREDPAVEVPLRVEENAVEWREIGLEKVVVVDGGLREKILYNFSSACNQRVKQRIKPCR